MPLVPALGRQGQADLCGASPVYEVNTVEPRQLPRETLPWKKIHVREKKNMCPSGPRFPHWSLPGPSISLLIA